MHELSLTRDIVDTVLDVSRRAGACKVKAVYFTIGSGRDIVLSLFKSYFARLSKDTIAEDAELTVNHTPFRVQCNGCQCIYHVNVLDSSTWDCPECGHHDYRLYSGMEFTIDKVEIE